MKRLFIHAIIMAFYWVFLLPTADAQNRQHNLRFSHHVGTTLSDPEAVSIAASASNVVATDSGVDDISCAVSINKDGSVTSFVITDGVIDNAEEFVRIERLNGDIKVVRAINWCGSTGAGIIGCARVPGSSLVMVRFSPSLEGILMAHEFGHNQGLNHRNGHNNLMHPSIGPTRVGINEVECNAFKGPARINAVNNADTSGFSAQLAPQSDTTALIKQHYFHGFPVAEGKLIPKEDAELIIRILKDENQKEWWPNALAALGLMNSDKSFKAITDFMENASGKDFSDPLSFRALATAPVALGYYVNVSQDEKALQYMVKAATPDRMQNNPEFQNLRVLDDDTTSVLAGSFMAALSVAVTEKDAVLEALKDIKNETGPEQPLIFDQLNQSKIEYERVKELGLEAYRSRNDDN